MRPPFVGYMGCDPCGTRWHATGGPNCWMCSRPGRSIIAVTVTSQHGSGYTGVGTDIQAAIRNGHDDQADPCGGGPIGGTE